MTTNRSGSAEKYDSARVAELAEQIVHHKRAYYAGRPEIADAAYDRLEDELRELAPHHPVLSMVGAEPEFTGRKVTHEREMLSLQKTYDVAELERWMNGHEVMGSIKVDGNSVALVYEGGELVQGKTRGNGRVGEEVTEKVTWVPDAVPSLNSRAKIEVRGELYCTESQFVRLSDTMAAMKLERPSNPRNIVAGLLGRKTYLDLMRFFNFFAFDVVDYEGALELATEEQKFQWLEDAGFRLPHCRLLKKPEDVEKYLEFTRNLMDEGEIGIDGAVFSYNQLALHHELGFTSHHPRFKMSFKWQGETAEAVITEVTWSTSRLGVATPVAIIEPVQLSGAKITNITLHNAEHVKAYNLKKGDKIEIVRSGEVIPKFLQVIQPAEGSYGWPGDCPACGTALDFDGIRLKCPNTKGCPAQRLGMILNWIKNADIDDLSEKRLLPLMEQGLVKAPGDLYRLDKDDFLVIPQTKEKLATKLYNNVQQSRRIPLAQFLNGLGIEGAGRTTWEKILETYPTLDSLSKAGVAEIEAIEGFARKTASQIVEGLQAKKPFIDDLLAAGVEPQSPQPSSSGAAGGVLSGQTFVITGALSRPRSQIESAIKEAGGKTASSVSKSTTAIITNEPDSTSSKMRKARELEIPVWSEGDLQQALGE